MARQLLQVLAGVKSKIVTDGEVLPAEDDVHRCFDASSFRNGCFQTIVGGREATTQRTERPHLRALWPYTEPCRLAAWEKDARFIGQSGTGSGSGH
jgi:hypothetical protein